MTATPPPYETHECPACEGSGTEDAEGDAPARSDLAAPAGWATALGEGRVRT